MDRLGKKPAFVLSLAGLPWNEMLRQRHRTRDRLAQVTNGTRQDRVPLNGIDPR